MVMCVFHECFILFCQFMDQYFIILFSQFEFFLFQQFFTNQLGLAYGENGKFIVMIMSFHGLISEYRGYFFIERIKDVRRSFKG